MSEQEKKMLENIRKLPPELRSRFADTAAGAVMALDVLSCAAGAVPAINTERRGRECSRLR